MFLLVVSRAETAFTCSADPALQGQRYFGSIPAKGKNALIIVATTARNPPKAIEIKIIRVPGVHGHDPWVWADAQ